MKLESLIWMSRVGCVVAASVALAQGCECGEGQVDAGLGDAAGSRDASLGDVTAPAADATSAGLDAAPGHDSSVGEDAFGGPDGAVAPDAASITADAPFDARLTFDSRPLAPDASTGSDGGADAPPPVPSSGFDVVLLAGQSNMVGRGLPETLLPEDSIDEDIMQWGRIGDGNYTIIPARPALDHNIAWAIPDRVGMGLAFGKAYRSAQPSPRPLLLVPTARGGTGFSSEPPLAWNPGDGLLEDAIARATAAMTSDPGNRFVGILWHQGEREANATWTQAMYEAAFDRMLANIRARVPGAGNAPVVVGEFVPAWSETRPSALPILAAHRSAASRLGWAALAPSTGLVGLATEPVHFDGPSIRQYGQRYAMALGVAIADAAGPPGTPRSLAVAPSEGTAVLSWMPPAALGGSRFHGYRVRWRLGSGPWMHAHAERESVTLSGLVPGASYVASVATLNDGGVGAESRIEFTTPTAELPRPEHWFTFDARNASNSGVLGGGRDGVATRVTYTTDALHGTVATFAGTGSIRVPVALRHTSYTITAWVRFDGAGAGTIVAAINDPTTGALVADDHALFRPSGAPAVLRARHGPSPIVEAPVLPAIGTWAHVAITYDANTGTAVLYANGVEASRRAGVARLAPQTPGVFLGATDGGGGAGLVGALDDVRIYDRDLTAGEIRQVYEADL